MSHLPCNFHKCHKLVISVANDVQTCCHDDDTKEALITSHMTDLKEENWLTEVKQILTPEKSPKTKVLRGNAPPVQLHKRWHSPIMVQGAL